MPKFPNADVLCLYGSEGIEAKSLILWLKKKETRRLFLIDEEDSPLLSALEKHPAVTFLLLETPLAVSLLAKKVAWRAVFKELAFHSASTSTFSIAFEKALHECHAAAHLLLSDAADFGSGLFSRFLLNSSPAKNGLALKDAFSGLPAVISGAGPSLEKNGAFLLHAKQESLLLAGGHATALLHKIGIEPHLTAAIDPICPSSEFGEQLFWQTPFLFQRRVNPANFSQVHAEKIAFPDSHFQFEAYLSGFDELWEGGWTVGTFLIQLAVWMGCNPIIWVGMDLNNQKDFWMAARFLEELAIRYPGRRFINATEGGVSLASPIRSLPLKEAIRLYGHPYDFEGSLHQILSTLPEAPLLSSRLKKWKKSLKQGGDLVERLLLDPLWDLWRPIFERESEDDGYPIPLEEKLRVHKTLFQKNILQEYATKNFF